MLTVYFHPEAKKKFAANTILIYFCEKAINSLSKKIMLKEEKVLVIMCEKYSRKKMF